MKPFAHLTRVGQLRRLRHVALAALADYNVIDAQLHLLSTTQGVVYRVDTRQRERFVLRLRSVEQAEHVAFDDQLRWLKALAQETPIPVPEPVTLSTGALSTTIHNDDYAEEQRCVLLRWVSGKSRRADKLTPATVAAIGTTIASLHQHAQQCQVPVPTHLRRWNSDTLVGQPSCLATQTARAWLAPTGYSMLLEASTQIGVTLDQLEGQPHAVGFIHADLGIHNFVFAGKNACPIDFDEWGCGTFAFDLAAPLRSLLTVPAYHALRHTLLTAYTCILPLPYETDEQLDMCIAAQCIGYLNWLFRYAPQYGAYAAPEVAKIKQLCRV